MPISFVITYISINFALSVSSKVANKNDVFNI